MSKLRAYWLPKDSPIEAQRLPPGSEPLERTLSSLGEEEKTKAKFSKTSEIPRCSPHRSVIYSKATASPVVALADQVLLLQVL